MAERNLLKEIRDFLNPPKDQLALVGALTGMHRAMDAKAMIREWKELPEKDKADIRNGIENGSLTY